MPNHCFIPIWALCLALACAAFGSGCFQPTDEVGDAGVLQLQFVPDSGIWGVYTQGDGDGGLEGFGQGATLLSQPGVCMAAGDAFQAPTVFFGALQAGYVYGDAVPAGVYPILADGGFPSSRNPQTGVFAFIVDSNRLQANGGQIVVTHATKSAGAGTYDVFFTLVDGGAAELSGAFDTAACP